jgi:hypothetical protein
MGWIAITPPDRFRRRVVVPDVPDEAARLIRNERRLRLEALQLEVANADSTCIDAVDRLLLSAKELQQEQPEVGTVVENLTAAKELLEFERASAGKLVAFDEVRGIVGPDSCHFFSPVFLDKHGKDENGTVYFCAENILFIGDSRIEFSQKAEKGCVSASGIANGARSEIGSPNRIPFRVRFRRHGGEGGVGGKQNPRGGPIKSLASH